MRYFSFDQTIGESKIYGFGGASGSIQKLSLEDYLLTEDGLPALTYAMSKLIPDGVAWDLDIENRRVKYEELAAQSPVPAPVGDVGHVFADRRNPSVTYSTRYQAGEVVNASIGAGWTFWGYHPVEDYCLYTPNGGNNTYGMGELKIVAPPEGATVKPATIDVYIAITAIADNVVSNAADGNAESIAAVAATLPRP